MKKLLSLLVLVLIGINMQGQKIIRDETDAFTGARMIETSTERIAKTGIGQIYLSVRKVNNLITIPCALYKKPVVKYTDDSGLILLFENGATAYLTTAYTGMGTEDYGWFAEGCRFNAMLSVDKDDIKNIRTQKITAIRLTYFGGKYDFKIEGEQQGLLKNMMELALSRK